MLCQLCLFQSQHAAFGCVLDCIQDSRRPKKTTLYTIYIHTLYICIHAFINANIRTTNYILTWYTSNLVHNSTGLAWLYVTLKKTNKIFDSVCNLNTHWLYLRQIQVYTSRLNKSQQVASKLGRPIWNRTVLQDSNRRNLRSFHLSNYGKWSITRIPYKKWNHPDRKETSLVNPVLGSA